MRILIVTQHYWPSIGGAESMLRRLAACWVRQGHQVTVRTTKEDADSKSEELDLGVRVLRQTVSRARFLGTVGYLRRLSHWSRQSSSQFDVIYVSMLKHAAFAVLGVQLGIPVVLRAEGAGPTGDMAWQKRAVFGAWIQRRCRAASAIVAPSTSVATELREAGYDQERVHLIPNGVVVPKVPWAAAATLKWRNRLGIQKSRTIAFVGRLHEAKGLLELVDAASAASRSIGPLQLLLVGDGPLRPVLTARADSSPAELQIVLAGPVDDAEPYLRAADVFVLPSYAEGLSVALLEALALGMPAVASDIPANREIAPEPLLHFASAQDPRALAAKLLHAIGDEDRAATRIEARRARVREAFDLECVAARHLELFERLCGASKDARSAALG